MTRRASAQASRNKGGRQVSTRQRHLLALLDALGDNTGKLDFQKLLFLYCKEPSLPDQESANLYEFVPYRYGAFSFTCYADCRHLVDRGLLIDNDQQWMLSEEGKRIAARAQAGSSLRICGPLPQAARRCTHRGNLPAVSLLRDPQCHCQASAPKGQNHSQANRIPSPRSNPIPAFDHRVRRENTGRVI